MLEITFSKAGAEDIILTEDDLHDWSIRQKCFDNTFELGGVCAAELYLLIDNADMFARNAFANTTITVHADGELLGTFTPELPKRRDGIVEITAYDDMVKLDEEYKQEDDFPIIFWNAYKGIAAKIGIPEENIIYDDVLGGSGGIGFLNQDFETLMPAQSYRNVLAGMSQFNGAFATITPDKKLLIKAFGKTVVREFSSLDLLDYDYSDETITFSKIIVEVAKSREFEGGGRVELGDDTGYTLVLDRTYINGGLGREDYMQLIDFIWDYYDGFTLTPMELTLPDPDYSLRLGDRIRLYVAADDVTVEGNISAIEYTDSPVSQIITCGGFSGSGAGKLFTDSKSAINTLETQQTNNAGGDTAKYLQTSDSAKRVYTTDNGLEIATEGAQGTNGGASFSINVKNTSPAHQLTAYDRLRCEVNGYVAKQSGLSWQHPSSGAWCSTYQYVGYEQFVASGEEKNKDYNRLYGINVSAFLSKNKPAIEIKSQDQRLTAYNRYKKTTRFAMLHSGMLYDSDAYITFGGGTGLMCAETENSSIFTFTVTPSGGIFFRSVGPYTSSVQGNIRIKPINSNGDFEVTCDNKNINFATTGNVTINGEKIVTENIEAMALNSVSPDLESRISALEQQVAELTALLQKGQTNA